MLGWISDRFASTDEAAGPLGSVRAARALIARLESESPQYALDELAKRYHAAPREVLRAKHGARALGELDEWAQRLLDGLWKSLLADSQGQTIKEAVWGSLARYYRRSAQAHWGCLDTSETADPSREQALSLVAARGVAAFGRYLLLQHMHYLDVAEDSWIQLWRLCAQVQHQGAASTALPLYPGTAMTTTIEREVLVALLTAVAPTGNLLPGQMLALDQVLRIHASYYRTADRYEPQMTPFAYQPSRNEPPQRHLHELRALPGMRFFGPGTAYAELCRAREEARSARTLPQWLVGTGCSAEGYAELLDRLVAQWSADPPRRRHRREPCAGEIAIAHDLATIRRLVKFSELAIAGHSLQYDAGNIYKLKETIRSNGEALLRDPRGAQPAVTAKEALANLLSYEKSLDPAATQTWQLSDSSESGLGAIAGTECAWVKVGMVVGFRHRDSAEWQIAIVRRLSRTARGELLVGMARLGGQVRSARLRRGIAAIDYSRSSSPGSGEIEYDAISLREATNALLLPVGVFDSTEKYTLTCDERQRIVKMERTLERRPNFERVEISEIELLRAA